MKIYNLLKVKDKFYSFLWAFRVETRYPRGLLIGDFIFDLTFVDLLTQIYDLGGKKKRYSP